ncbi:MAG TPA: tetratricopeptide repeat protein [Leptolyngbyaceae cyanobacterium M65_K2018_010]|nr:tetratricopeptide repeat protein [Leptolyngbyaceae cyanobacterium M65_K2018_010]
MNLSRLLRRYLCLGSLAILPWMAQPGLASNLNQQLNIQPNNPPQGRSRQAAEEWMQLGNQQAASGQLEEAVLSWAEAAEIYRFLGDTRAQGQAYSAMAIAYISLGEYPQAEPALNRRIAAARESNDLLGVIFGLNNLGSLYLNQGRLNEGQAKFEEALVLARPTRNPQAIGLSLSNLGLVATEAGDLDKAVKLLEVAANYRLQAGDTLGYAHTSNNLGDVYLALGRENNAIGAYRVALAEGEKAADANISLRALDGLLTIYFGRDQMDIAKTYLDLRVALTPNTAAPNRQTAVTLRWLGDYYFALGDYPRALEAYHRGLAIARSLAIPSLQVEFNNRLLQF